MYHIFDLISQFKLIPVITIENKEKAEPLVNALQKGGLPCAEFTLRTDDAFEAIRIISKRNDILLGAGTVLTIEQVKKAVDAGAKFIVTPGFNPKVVWYCIDREIPIIPGTSSPTDFEAALSYGLEVVKFFPAEALGGIKVLKAMSAPYRDLKFMPSGGVNAGNIRDYINFEKVLACGGSWIVKPDFIDHNEFEEITTLTREAVEIIKK